GGWAAAEAAAFSSSSWRMAVSTSACTPSFIAGRPSSQQAQIDPFREMKNGASSVIRAIPGRRDLAGSRVLLCRKPGGDRNRLGRPARRGNAGAGRGIRKQALLMLGNRSEGGAANR